MKRWTKHAAWMGLLMGWGLTPGCTWEPSARPAQPVLLAEGNFEVLGMLDESRYAGFARDPETAPAVGIVDLRNEKRCELAENTFPITSPITGSADADDQPPFLWPSAHFSADKEPTLTFSDETCTLYDVDATISDTVYPITLDEDQRQIVLFGDGKGKLSYYDPWNDELRVIATGVSRFLQAQRPQSNSGPVGPQALWLIENGVLTLRTFDSKIVVQRGKAVSELTQAAFTTLRVAFVDGGDLYEAVAPDYKRALIAADACSPQYNGAKIAYFSPCGARQLERLDLSSGERETFEPGVYAQWEQSGFEFERALDEQGKNQLFVTPPGGKRTQVEPTLLSEVQALDSTRIVGTDGSDNFGIWSKADGFRPILRGTGRIVAFIDTRTNRLSWVAMHQVEEGRGTLSYLEQPSFTLETIATKVATPSVSVLQIAPVSEPVLVYVRDANVTLRENQAPSYNGKLDTRVLSGDLESSISDDVTSYTLVPNPNAAGLLYTTQSAKESGLWFAAL